MQANLKERRKFWRGVFGKDLVLPIILLTLSVGAQPLTSYYMGQFMNALTDSKLSLAYYLPIFGGISLSAAILGAVSQQLLGKASARIIGRLRKQFFENMMSKPAKFYETETNGRILQLVMGECTILQGFIKTVLSELIKSSIGTIYYVVTVFLVSWYFGFILVGECTITLIFSFFYNKKSRNVWRDKQQVNGLLSSFTMEVLSGWKTIKIYDLSPSVLGKLNGIIARFLKQENRESLAVFANSFFVAIIYSFAIVGSGVLASFLISEGQLRYGDLYVAWSAMLSVLGNMRVLAAKLLELQSIEIAATSVYNTIFKEKSENIINGNITQLNHWDINFTDVSFSFQRGPVLKSFSLIMDGQFTAIVGTSGAGKSTVLSLILGLHKPDVGTIKLGDVDISALQKEWYYSKIGYVAQDTFLFNESIEENIRCGSSLEFEEVVEAATFAAAHEFIMDFPEGYKTILGERGVQLSGGQKQRISIARALLRKPSVLILDEATSALDSKTEEEIQFSLRTLLQKNKMKLIVVAHRLSTVRHADKIVVVQKGCIEEIGTYEQLLQQNGVFASMVTLQSLDRQDKPRDRGFTV